MMMPSRVDVAPWMTGANVCCSAMHILLSRLPMLVRNPWK